MQGTAPAAPQGRTWAAVYHVRGIKFCVGTSRRCCKVMHPSVELVRHEWDQVPHWNQGRVVQVVRLPPHPVPLQLVLLAEQVVAGGPKANAVVGVGHVGGCTLHARECGAGVGMFFLVQR